jgi:hypothetical protein
MKEIIMKHKITVVVGLALVALISSRVLCSQYKSVTSGAAAANTSWSGTRKEEVVDPAYGMTAFTIEVPIGVEVCGHDSCAPVDAIRPRILHPALSYTSQSPDGT